MKNNFYQCNKCNRIMIRESDKKRIKSYCDEMKKDGILIRIDDKNKMIKKMRKKHLKHGVDLSTFKSKDRLFLEYAFEQGATVMFNSIKL